MIKSSVYALMVAAFRADPGNKSRAAREADVNRRTAILAWEQGLWVQENGRKTWKLPLKTVFEEERLKAAHMVAAAEEAATARAADDKEDQRFLDLLAVEKKGFEEGQIGSADRVLALLAGRDDRDEERRRKAERDKAAARAEETLIARLARGNAKTVLGQALPLTKTLSMLTRAAAFQVEREFFLHDPKTGQLVFEKVGVDAAGEPVVMPVLDPDKKDEVDLKDVLALLARALDVLGRGAAVAEAAQRIERLAIGEPAEGAERRGDDMTAAEAFELLGHASEVHDKTRKLGAALAALPGGEAPAKEPADAG